MEVKQKQGELFHQWTQRLLMETKVKEWKTHELLAMHTIITDEILWRAKVEQLESKHKDEQTND